MRHMSQAGFLVANRQLYKGEVNVTEMPMALSARESGAILFNKWLIFRRFRQRMSEDVRKFLTGLFEFRQRGTFVPYCSYLSKNKWLSADICR